jgi:pimeloyl-ACP methyl ester carboxylesterase
VSDIVICHGIGYQFKHRETALTEWYEKLRTGMMDTAVHVALPQQVSAVYYGNCYRSRDGKGGASENEFADIPMLRPGDVRDPTERALLEALAEGLESPGPGTKGLTQSALRRLEACPGLGQPPARFVIWLVRQVHRYLDENDTVRACALQRVERVVTPATRVVIGHSLGSVIAYEALRVHPEWNIDTFITLGSPLGVGVIQKRLQPPILAGGRSRWPNVARWINVAAQEDPIALVKKLGPFFGGAVEDHLVVNTGLSRFVLGGHSVLRYLTTSEVAEGVADALGRG